MENLQDWEGFTPTGRTVLFNIYITNIEIYLIYRTPSKSVWDQNRESKSLPKTITFKKITMLSVLLDFLNGTNVT